MQQTKVRSQLGMWLSKYGNYQIPSFYAFHFYDLHKKGESSGMSTWRLAPGWTNKKMKNNIKTRHNVNFFPLQFMVILQFWPIFIYGG